MKRFRYRLERVLQFRDIVREERRREVALANQALAQAQGHLQFLESERLKNWVEPGAALELEQLLMVDAYRERLTKEIEQQQLLIIDLTQKRDEALERYRVAAQEAESLQRHRNAKFTEYQEFHEREAQKVMDELVVQRFGR